MTLVVFPRLSRGTDTVQVFVGDLAGTRAQQPTFVLDGVVARPRVHRPMTSARGPDEGVAVNSTSVRAFTGVFEFAGLDPARASNLEVRLGGETKRVVLRALPRRIPAAADGGFEVLLASCFCVQEHNPATLAAALRQLQADIRPTAAGVRAPNCAFFMGDQVYLDLPSLTDFPSNRARLAQKFEADYTRNWGGALAALFEVAPSVAVPDDHEFWNNAPHSSPFIQNSWKKAGRDAWRAAADAAFAAYARPYPRQGGQPGDEPFVFDVSPVSFFFADGRSGRSETQAFTEPCRVQLEKWVDRLNAERLVGVFVTGQSLFRAPADQISGQVADKELPNYKDYASVVRCLQRVKRPMLSLTGDVHWGRVTVAKDAAGSARITEVVVSPASLVTTAGADELADFWSGLRGLFGHKDPWPRHSAAEAPPASFGTGAGRYRCEVARAADGSTANVKGDQLGRLSFAYDRSRQRLTAAITYYAIQNSPRAPIRVPLLDISLAG